MLDCLDDFIVWIEYARLHDVNHISQHLLSFSHVYILKCMNHNTYSPPDDDSSDDDDDDVQAAPPQQTMPRGMGKQLQPPPQPRDDDDDDDDSDSSDDSVPQVPVGSGKRLGGMSGGGKQLRRQS